MPAYYVNKHTQENGDHEVHKSGCPQLPDRPHRIYLGAHRTCDTAVDDAREYYDQVNGCYHCALRCHTT